ncbi:Proline dehydrogenase 1, mitochondrial, partial [Geodia barretti]
MKMLVRTLRCFRLSTGWKYSCYSTSITETTKKAIEFEDTGTAYQDKSTRDLLRHMFVFSIFSYENIVNRSQKLVKFARDILGSKMFNKVMKMTVYGQFVAGENIQAILPVIDRYRRNGVRAILDYAVEEDTPNENVVLETSFTTQIAIRRVHQKYDTVAVSDLDKASLFNQYFYSVFTRSTFQLPSFSELKMPTSSLSDINFSELDVFRVLRSLDVSKAMGCDGISPKILKHCALALYQPFHHLFSLSISQSYLPIEWRTHLIKPIFKSGDKNSVRNYRPISLLSVVSKVLEKLVYNSTVDFITTISLSISLDSYA